MEGMGLFFPQAHADFSHWVPEEERSDLLSAYEKRLFGEDKDMRMAAARMWFKYTESCSLLKHDPELVEEAAKDDAVVYGAGHLDAFYFRSRMFLEEGQLLSNLHRLAHLPAIIIQGGHDVIAPPFSAYLVHRAWPGSVLHIAADAGHSPSEPGIRTKVIQALEQFKHDMKFDASYLGASGTV